METLKRNKKNNRLWMFLAVAVFLTIGVIGLVAGSMEDQGILKQLRQERGYIRTVEKSEYDFFQKLVSRDAIEELSDEQLGDKTKEMINRANAEFILGYQMGLCGPYSFESFSRNMETENMQRKIMKENQEIFYGPEQFDLVTYYAYIIGNLKLDMVSFIKENADREVIRGARKYFKQNRENYRTIEKITYELNENGNVSEKEVFFEDLSTLEKTDSQLFEFLYSGKENDEMEYIYKELFRNVKIVSVEYEKLNYKNNAERVMKDYITNIYLENWIQEIEEKCPVEFKI